MQSMTDAATIATLVEENGRLREEIKQLVERQARRELEFRAELRAMASQCASLAASSAVTSAAATTATAIPATARHMTGGERAASMQAEAAVAMREALDRLSGAETEKGTSRGVNANSASRPATAWEVPNAWPPRESSIAATRERERAIREEEEEAKLRAARVARAARAANRDAFVGDLSSFFFKTAKHDAPVWRKREDVVVDRVLESARAHDDEYEDQYDDGYDDGYHHVGSRASDIERIQSPVFGSSPKADALEHALADTLRAHDDDDDDLVSALLRGGIEGERAADVLAQRLRDVGFTA